MIPCQGLGVFSTNFFADAPGRGGGERGGKKKKRKRKSGHAVKKIGHADRPFPMALLLKRQRVTAGKLDPRSSSSSRRAQRGRKEGKEKREKKGGGGKRE